MIYSYFERTYQYWLLYYLFTSRSNVGKIRINFQKIRFHNELFEQFSLCRYVVQMLRMLMPQLDCRLRLLIFCNIKDFEYDFGIAGSYSW